MMKLATKVAVFAAATVIGLANISPVAVAQTSGSEMFQANLTSLNDSGATAVAWVELSETNEAKVTIETQGLLKDQPHAQHLHYSTDSNNVCPTPERAGEDKIISTVEGQPDYGEVIVSLTEDGATDDKSALAVDRFPSGNYKYERTIQLNDEDASDLRDDEVAVVIHGIDINGNGKYDNDDDQGVSSLDPKLPLEATAPAACGILAAAPTGGVATGGGSTAGVENAGLLAFGTGAIALAGGSLLYSNRERFSLSKKS